MSNKKVPHKYLPLNYFEFRSPMKVVEYQIIIILFVCFAGGLLIFHKVYYCVVQISNFDYETSNFGSSFGQHFGNQQVLGKISNKVVKPTCITLVKEPARPDDY